MKRLPTRTWRSIISHGKDMGLDRAGALKAQGVQPYAGYGKGCEIPNNISYAAWLAQQKPDQDDDSSTPGFDLNLLADNLTD
jgi:hypothetical protein